MTLVWTLRSERPLGGPVLSFVMFTLWFVWGGVFVLGFLCEGVSCDVREAELLYSGDVGEMQQLFEVGDGVFPGVTRVLMPRVCKGLTLEDQMVVCLLRP